MIGRSIAHYSILDKLGEGGMGAVYKARDTHLDRFVALKVLPPDKMSDPERRRRFVLEAKSASALNHPNIVTIYDIDEAEGVHFIAMEYVEGKTLDRLIGRKGLPLNEALKYGIQIADGLGKAHAAGIVHRDLKPANVMVTGDGAVKILDFGLAKLVERIEETDESAATKTIAQTPKTEEGKILGTVAYMSPEQAEGKPVDARSDIFSFGSVFYEMLTGRRPFTGETRASTLAEILTSEPQPPSEIAAAVPVEAERAVMRCLRKDPQRRMQTMSDLKVLLQDLKEESESGKLSAVAAAPGRRGRRTWLLVALAGLFVVAVGAGAVWWLVKRNAGPASFEVERLTFESGIANSPAISPDGKLIAYASDRTGGFDLYVRQINSQQAIRLTQNEANDWQPCFSPDGAKIAFRSERDGGGIYVVDALGGVERKIADGGRLPVFSPDGSTVLYVLSTAITRRAKLFLVPANGGAPRPFHPDFMIPPVGGSHSSPVWSPDGKHILFDGVRPGDPKSRSWWIAPVAGGDAVRISPPPSALNAVIRFVAAWQGNYVYYSEGTAIGGMSLYRVAMAEGPWRVAGVPEKLASPAGMVFGVSVSADGRLIFASMTPSINIWSLALKANEGLASGQLQPVTSDSSGKTGFAVDAKGSKIAWVSYTRLNSIEIRIRDLAAGREDLIAGSGNSIMLYPRMSADGSRLAYRDVVDGKPISFVTGPGTTSARQVCERCSIHGFFANPAEALVQTMDLVVRQNLAAGSRVPLIDLSEGQQLSDFALSPADRLVAFTRARPDGFASLYVAPVGRQALAENAWIQVAEDRNYLGNPAWSPDGKLLYHASARDGFICVWAQRIAGDGKPADQPFAVWHGHAFPNFAFGVGARIEVTPDKLYMLMTGIKGDLWSMKLNR